MKENLGSIAFILAVIVVIGGLAFFYQGQILPKYNNPEIDSFIQSCFETLDRKIGAPEYSIDQVVLIVQPGDGNARSGFVDREGGEFYISIPYVPDKRPKWETFGAIAHETMHIYRKSIGDPCMEGLSDLFACHMLNQVSLEGGNWDKFLANSTKYPFYKEAYLMMKELKDCVGEKELLRLFDYQIESVAIQKKHFDLNSWLLSLGEKESSARAILDSHKDKIKQLMPPIPPLVFDYN